MSERNRMLTGGARALTGLVVIAAAGAGVVALATVDLPAVNTTPTAITVDTTQDTARTLVCAGSFAELGLDPDRPSVAIPVGAPSLTIAGEPSESGVLARIGVGDGPASVHRAPAEQTLGVAQAQLVETEDLKGLAASSCAEPLNEQWLLGGATAVGTSTTLSLGNPGSVSATVQISLFDEKGPIEAVQSAGVIVPPGAEQIVSVNGYATERGRIGARVVSTGAPVTASLGVAQVEGINPFAVSSVTRQAEPKTQLVIPGVANESDREAGPSDAGEGDQYPVTVRALAPGGEIGVATVRALDDEGRSTDLGQIDLLAGSVGELLVQKWPKGASTVVIESETPIVGGVLGSVQKGKDHDNQWFSPAPEILPGAATAVPIVAGGRLVIANLGDASAVVTIADQDDDKDPKKVTVGPGSSVLVSAPTRALLKSDHPVYAGVRVLDDGALAGYPVLPADPRDGELTVHTR